MNGDPSVTRGIVCDNGPEFASQCRDRWANARGGNLQFIRPGSRSRTATSKASTGAFGTRA